MGFLAPALLGLGLLAGVPVLVHLLRRRVGRTVAFPAVRYLTRMEQEHSREMKLRHRLLLLLRILAVLAIAMAAARPIARLAGLGHAPVAVAIVIDNSMSSGAVVDGRALLDDLRADALALAGALSADDRAWVVTADGRVIGGNGATLREALTTLRPLGGRGDLAAALRRAASLARSGAPRAPVVALVSDGQPNALESAGDSVLAMADMPLVTLVRSRGVLRNRAVVAARAEPARWTPTGAVTFALASTDSAAWRVVLDGRTVARGTAGPGTVREPVRVAQRLGSSSTGWVRGSVELEADELRGDDARWFAVRVAPPPSVTVRPESGPFLSTALATLVEEKRLARGSEGIPGVVTVAGADAPGLRGAVLLVAPSDPIRVGEANRTLARLGIPWRFGAIARDLVLTRAAGRTMGLADSTRSPEPVAPGQARAADALDDVPVRLRYPLVYSPGTARSAAAGEAAAGAIVDTLAVAGGAPWAVAGPEYVLIASPLDPDATDFPVRAGFVPWLLDALSRRLGDEGRVVEAHPGARLSGFEGVSAIERPDGTLLSLGGDRLTVPNEAGVYFLRRQGARVGALVVNPEPEESEVAARASGGGTGSASGGAGGRVVGADTVETVPMLARVTGRSIVTARDGEAWRMAVLDAAVGRSLLPPLVALALAALLLEAWFARERGRGGVPKRAAATAARAA